jgi:carbon storage regulator
MLIIARKVNEEIVIGEGPHQVRLIVCEIRDGRGKVRLGFEASPEVPIHRREVYDRIQAGKPHPKRSKSA